MDSHHLLQPTFVYGDLFAPTPNTLPTFAHGDFCTLKHMSMGPHHLLQPAFMDDDLW